jgi:hypothetical protein
MAVTENIYTGDGSTVLFSFTFPYLDTSNIKVSLAGADTTAYTLANATTVQMDTAPGSGVQVRIYRVSDEDSLDSTFYPGSSIRAADLNDNFLQLLYLNQETLRTASEATTGAIVDGSITTAKLGSQVVTNAKLADNAVATANIQDEAVTNDKLAEGVTTQAGFRNLIINGNPIINQRGYVSGTNTTGNNEYTLDRWRVFVSGENLTFTDSNGIRTVTAPANGVTQVVEGASILGGTYTLSWNGTATAVVNGAPVANGANVVLPGGVDAIVRLSNGTFSLVQLETGTHKTPFEPRPLGVELALCQRYYQVGTIANYGYAPGANFSVGNSYEFPVTMRAAPTITLSGGSETNISAVDVISVFSDGNGFSARGVSTSAASSGGTFWRRNFTAVIEL